MNYFGITITMESPSTPTKITLAELLSSRFAPVQDVMLSILFVDDLSRLCASSKVFADLKTAAWNFVKLLGIFSSNPRKFRSLQGKWNALVSGKMLVEFLRRVDSFFPGNQKKTSTGGHESP
jgi:hypothetical protein